MLNEISHVLRNKQPKRIIRCLKSALPQKWVMSWIFKLNHHRNLDWIHPTVFDEKLIILYVRDYSKSKLVKQCADKFAVRSYVKERCGNSLLVPLLGVYEKASEIRWDTLPERFALKCNHGSGYNIIVPDIAKLDREKAVKQLDYWMKEDYGVMSAEVQYKHIPRKILAEPYLGKKDGSFPTDYKFHCSWGKPFCCQVITGRESKTKWAFVDRNFKNLHLIDDVLTDEQLQALRPSCYDKMFSIAQKLSADFPYVRVDLYDYDGQVLFGELTFTPYGNNNVYMSEKTQEWLGQHIYLESPAKS